MELTNSRLSRASRASSGSRWLHVATQAHELASLLDETVSNQSGDQRRAPTYVNVVNARQEVSHRVGALPQRGEDSTPSLAIRTLEFRLGSRHARASWGGVRSASTCHRHTRAIGQGSQRGVEVQNCAPRSSRAWLNAAAFDRGKSSLATTRASRTLSVDWRRRARALDQRWYPRRRHTRRRRRRPRRSPCTHRPRAVVAGPRPSLGTAPSNSSRIIIAASWSAFARR